MTTLQSSMISRPMYTPTAPAPQSQENKGINPAIPIAGGLVLGAAGGAAYGYVNEGQYYPESGKHITFLNADGNKILGFEAKGDELVMSW
jgi:hypothetical protein